MSLECSETSIYIFENFLAFNTTPYFLPHVKGKHFICVICFTPRAKKISG